LDRRTGRAGLTLARVDGHGKHQDHGYGNRHERKPQQAAGQTQIRNREPPGAGLAYRYGDDRVRVERSHAAFSVGA